MRLIIIGLIVTHIPVQAAPTEPRAHPSENLKLAVSDLAILDDINRGTDADDAWLAEGSGGAITAFEIDNTPIPESSIALLCMIATLLLLRRRRS